MKKQIEKEQRDNTKINNEQTKQLIFKIKKQLLLIFMTYITKIMI